MNLKANSSVEETVETVVERHHLSQDGWFNNSITPFIGHSFFDGTSSQFLSIKDFGSNKKTAEYCADLAEQAIIGISIYLRP